MANNGSFKIAQFDVKQEPKLDDPFRVVKLDAPTAPDVQDFRPARLKEPGKGEYGTTKAVFGSLAATDPDRHSRSQKDSRFAMSPILRDPLTVEAEERRVIEERVSRRIEELSEEARKAAAEEGFKAGYKKGYDEAFTMYREEGKKSLSRFEQFLTYCESAKTEIFKANERFIVELIYRVARMVLLRELKSDEGYLVRLSGEILERIGAKENIKIQLNPVDLAIAGQLKEGLEKRLGSLKNLVVEPSAAVEGGGCIIETQWNAIDASVETQLTNLHESIIGAKASG